MEHHVHFIVATFVTNCRHSVLHIHASLAERERKMILARVKAALVCSKSSLGLHQPMKRSKAFRHLSRNPRGNGTTQGRPRASRSLPCTYRVGASAPGWVWQAGHT